MTRPDPEPDGPPEIVADTLIAEHNGDAHAAVVALVRHVGYLEARIEALENSVSWGYVRALGRLANEQATR